MRFAFTDEQQLMRAAVRDLLARLCPPERVRAVWDEGTGHDPEAWAVLVDQGWTAIAIPEAYGGQGLDAVWWALLAEEAGRAALPCPLVEAALVGAPTLAQLGNDSLAETWLPRVVRGEGLVLAALSDEPLTAHAQLADLLLLEHEGAVHAVDRSDVTLVTELSVDRCRQVHRVQWTPKDATVVSPATRAACGLAGVRLRATLGAAAQLLGLGRHLVATAIEYAKVRTQFGRPIGSFQAVQHQLADAHLALEFAAPMVYRAAWSLAHPSATTGPDMSMAKAYASEAAERAARTALQVHGAIGYSDECDLHLWMKRVWALSAASGNAGWHTVRVGDGLH